VKNAAGAIMPNLPVVPELAAASGSSSDQAERRYRLIFKE